MTSLEPILSKTAERNQIKEARPATARSARHTTEKYSLLFSFCARRISFSLNEKSIFLWCLAMNCKVAGLAFLVGGLLKECSNFVQKTPSIGTLGYYLFCFMPFLI